MSSTLYDALIIGGGPAGLAAALPMARQARTALVFTSNEYRNEGARHMHMVPGLDHVEPAEFRRRAREQIQSRYKTIAFEDAKITVSRKLVDSGHFEVEDQAGRKWMGKKLVLATGSADTLTSEIEGYKENWPAHIYQCPFCDGLEDSGQPVGILGFPSPVHLHYALAGLRFDDRVFIFMTGEEPPQDEPTQGALKTALASGVKIDDRKIKRFVNNGPEHGDGMTIEFTNGDTFVVGCMYHFAGTVNRAQHLIDQLGIETTAPGRQMFGTGGEIVLKQFGETSVSGCYAAGDTMAIQKAAVGAISSGGMAGAGVCMALAMEEGKAAVAAEAAKAPSCP